MTLCVHTVSLWLLLSIRAVSATLGCSPLLRLGQIAFSWRPWTVPNRSSADEGHFSVWARETKQSFLYDLEQGRGFEWILVMGNEAGDLDSLTSAHLWAFHLSHLRHPQKAVALLQTERDALDLRRENELALRAAKMAPRHRDLLTIDELPIPPVNVSAQVQSIVLVDANVPRKGYWDTANISSIMDHHADRGKYLDADPRLIEPTAASACSLVALQVLKYRHHRWHSGKQMPHELADLVLSTIAVDSKSFAKGDQSDWDAAKAIHGFSSYANQDLESVMRRLSHTYRQARKNLAGLGVRDLLRRDWKSDLVETTSHDKSLAIHLGFASVPMSLEDLVKRTPHASIDEFVEQEGEWTASLAADVSVVLTSHEDMEGNKEREIFLAVRHDQRLDIDSADALFSHIVSALEAAVNLDLSQWGPSLHMARRRKAYRNNVATAGRKIVRPIVEDAVRQWLTTQCRRA